MPLPVIRDLVDPFDRQISYLRLSVTDRCNYRCSYCMPEVGMVFRRRHELLTFEEIERLIRIFVGLGVRRVRLTGGEPTVRAGIVDLVALLAAIALPDREHQSLELVMTSNGHRLPELAEPLARAGLRGVNISLDTLDPDQFRALTRRGNIDPVLAGFDAALAAGLRVKLNAVALAGENDDQVAALCEFAWERGVVPRFIEHMPMSEGALYRDDQLLAAAEIRRRVQEHVGVPLEVAATAAHQGPARYWHPRGMPGKRFGIISAMSEHFCATCNRLRLSAIGELHACLGYDDATSLRDIVRAGGSDRDVEEAICRTVGEKRQGHQFQFSGAGGPKKHMVAIGG